MATSKTPSHKRIKRAETGREDWKAKASERREEIERLKKLLESRDAKLTELTMQNNTLVESLGIAHSQIDELKKKPFKS